MAALTLLPLLSNYVCIPQNHVSRNNLTLGTLPFHLLRSMSNSFAAEHNICGAFFPSMDISYHTNQKINDVIKWKYFLRYWPFCAGNAPVTGEFSSQRPVTRSFDVFFDLCLKQRLSKQSRNWWFETPLRPVWRHCNESQSVRNISNIQMYHSLE